VEPRTPWADHGGSIRIMALIHTAKTWPIITAVMIIGTRLSSLRVVRGKSSSKSSRNLLRAVHVTDCGDRPYCKAFNNHINSATKPSKCNSGTEIAGDWGFDVAEYAYEFTGLDFPYVGK